jgi:plastocyanin
MTRVRTGAIGVLALLVLAPAAMADETLYAVPVDRYSSSVVTVDQGEALIFRNVDLNRHDVVSKQQAGGKPLFSTPLQSTGGEAIVQGVQQLRGGNYEFFCSIHTYMTGTLTVTGAGAPAPAPGPSDTTAPKVGVRVLDSSVSKVRKNGKLRVEVTTDEGGNSTVEASIRSGGKTTVIARGTRGFARPGKVALPLTSGGKKVLRNRKSVGVTVLASVKDGAGNDGRGTGKRTLKR